MKYIFVIALGYLLGCSNMAKYIAAIKKVDLSAGGSGNPGASNAVILMGWGAGVLTALHDIGKSALAVVLARLETCCREKFQEKPQKSSMHLIGIFRNC